MASDSTSYKLVIETVLEDKIQHLGHLVLEKANGIPGVSVDNSGHITSITADPKQVLDTLLKALAQIEGAVATTSTAQWSAGALQK